MLFILPSDFCHNIVKDILRIVDILKMLKDTGRFFRDI